MFGFFGGGQNGSNHGSNQPSWHQQGQTFQQEETQTQQQAVFLDQTNMCLKMLEGYLEKIVEEADPELLSALGSTTNSTIKCMNMSGKDMWKKGMQEGLDAATGIICEFKDKNRARFGAHPRAKEVLDTAVEYLMLSVEGLDIPVIPVVDSGDTTTKGAGKTVNRVLMGHHEVKRIHDDAGENAAKYRAAQRAAAERGRNREAYEHLDVDSATLTKDLRGRLIDPVNPEEALRWSRQELNRMRRRQEEIEGGVSSIGVGPGSEPDLGFGGMDEDTKADPHVYGETYDELVLDAQETRKYLQWLDGVRPNDTVDVYLSLFGGMWAPAVVTKRDSNSLRLKVEFDELDTMDENHIKGRIVWHGLIHRENAVTKNGGVCSGKPLELDEMELERYEHEAQRPLYRQNAGERKHRRSTPMDQD